MYLLLLVFGTILTAAGMVLAASGVSIQERAFDATIVTPGIVAVIGGLVLIGLGLALRVLQRIENALAARPMPRATRAGEAVASTAASQLLSEPTRVSLPSKTASRPQAAPVVTPVSPPAADEKRLEDLAAQLSEKLPEKVPALTRFESTPAVAETDLSLAPKSLLPKSPSPSVPSLGGDEIGKANEVPAARRMNGAAPARTAPRLDLTARSPITSARPKGPAFDSLWPKGPRPMRAAQSAAAQSAAAQPTPMTAAAAPAAVEPEQNSEPALEPSPSTVAQDEAPAAVTILKSGVVDGMAYTLYSDGSIEAELPQGRLRFGSISELRNHIEQSA